MKNRELILTVLRKRLMDDSKAEGTVTVLSGPWGCGKTYLWNHDLLPQLPDHRTVTISLFGLESIAALKTQLMNQCLIRKAKSLGKGKLKQALTGGGSLLLVGFKMALKGADSYIGTNLLSWNIDPMQLVDENLIVCFDDLERISGKVGLDEILGLTNLLAEHKHCRVLLITNEEALLSRNNANSQTMRMYKERVVDYFLQVETDLESAFRLFLNQYRDSVKTHDYLTANQPFILQTMFASQHGNLRTLKKCLQIIAEIISFKEITLDPSLIPSIVALQIEEADGTLRDPDFYNFNEMAELIKNKLLKRKPDSGEQPSERLQFHRKYFGSSEGYHFVKAFYNCIKYGYFDWPALKSELNPKIQPEDPLTSALSAPQQSREWWYRSDREYAEWIKQIEDHLFSTRPIKTAELVAALVYLKYASDMSGVSLRTETDLRIRERLDQNASAGDESFTEGNRSFLSDQKIFWEPYLKDYDEKVRNAVVLSLESAISKAIEGEDLQSFLSQIKQKPEAVLAAVSEAGLNSLSTIFSKNRLFFNDAVYLLIEELYAYQRSHYIQNFEEKLYRIRTLVTDLLSRPQLDNSDRPRLKKLLEKISAADKRQSNEAPTQTSEAER